MTSSALVTGVVFAAVLLAIGLVVGVNEQVYRERNALLAQRIGSRQIAPENQTTRPPRRSVSRLTERAQAHIYRARLDATPTQLLLFSLVFAASGALLGLQNIGAWGWVGLVAGALPLAFVRYRQRVTLQALEEQLPTALESMISALRGGRTVERALEQAAEDAGHPLRDELIPLTQRLKLGSGLGEVLLIAKDRAPDFFRLHFLLSLLRLHQRTGGNLIDILGRLRDAQRELAAAEQRIAAASAEARTTAQLLFGLPLLVLGSTLLFFPNYLPKLLSFTGGQIALAGTTLWLIVGAVLTWYLARWEER